MRIHLVYPNFRSGNAGGALEPIGMLMVASAVRRAGHTVTFTDMTFQRDISSIDKHVHDADAIGIGCSTPLFGRAVEIVDRAKKLNPTIFSIAGGPHATLDPHDALDHGFNVAVIGEAEKTLVDLADCLDRGGDWHKLAGIAYTRENQLIENTCTQFIEDLNALPLPARDLIDQKKYIRRNDYASLNNTRGCPFKCLFCQPAVERLFGRKPRMRSAANVAEEIASVNKDFNARRFHFRDDTLLLCKEEWFEDFRKELNKKNLRIHWSCLGRADQINQRLLSSMKAAGLESIGIGVESGSQKLLDFYRKDLSINEIKTAFALCHKNKIMTHVFMMLGAPVETRDDLDKSVALLKELKPYSHRFYLTTPLPGTALYEYARERSLVEIAEYEQYDNALNLRQKRMPMRLKQLTLNDIQRCYRQMRAVYLFESAKRCLTSWGSFTLALRHISSAVKIAINRF